MGVQKNFQVPFRIQYLVEVVISVFLADSISGNDMELALAGILLISINSGFSQS